jgi:hypothetical protein
VVRDRFLTVPPCNARPHTVVIEKKPMRSLLLAVFLLLTLPIFQECHKRNPPLCCEPPVNSALTGTWRLIESAGGFSGDIQVVPSDTVILLRMHDDYSYARVYNGRNVDSGRYMIKDTIVFGFDRDTLAIVFGSQHPELFSFSGDSLFLGQEVSDQMIGIYLRTR